jgi:hypothetical protein
MAKKGKTLPTAPGLNEAWEKTQGIISGQRILCNEIGFIHKSYSGWWCQGDQEYGAVARTVADWTSKLHSSNKPHRNNYNNNLQQQLATTTCNNNLQQQLATTTCNNSNSASPTRIAGDDAMCLLRNGLASYILGIEKSMGWYLQENKICLYVLCGYNIPNGSNGKIDNEDINTLIAAHS